MAAEYVKVNIRLTKSELELLKAHADRLGVSYNLLIRRAVEHFRVRLEGRNAERPVKAIP